MAFPFTHLQVRFQGHFGASGTPTDLWSFGLRFGSPTNGVNYDAGSLQTFADACRNAYTTFHASANSFVGTSCYFTTVEAARIGQDGKYEPSGQLTVRSTQSPAAGTGAPTNPWNTCLVVSLRTANPRGFASNGRCYVPALAPSLNVTTGRIATGTVGSRLNTFKTFLVAANAAANTYQAGISCIVASSRGNTSATVVGIRSDDRLDSIERRENAQASIWATATIP